MHKLSDFFESYVGVKQGEPLSPLLFIIFINDMANEIASGDITACTLTQIQIFLLLFADDTVLFAETAADLQLLLDNLKVYCNKWNISVNIDKSKVVVFKSGYRRINCRLYFDNTEIEIVSSFTYLWVTLISNERFFQAQKSLAEQANKALFSLNKLFDKDSLNITEKLKLFDSMVLPILNYGCEIWGFHPAPNIEAVHLKFLKQLLKVRYQTSSAMVYGELGRVPLIIKRKERILNIGLRLTYGWNIVEKCLP